MEKIETPALANIIIDGNTYRKANCVSEVSRYGVISSINGEVRHNTVGGFLVRVKSEQDNEGGVIAGTGAISAWRICEEKAL